jgi:DNA-binding response OmpR family regulator
MMTTTHKNILIIDADPTTGDQLKEALHKENRTITVSVDGRELFDKQRKLPVPDLVIVDILELRPGVDTFRFIRTLKGSEKTKHCKIIVCSHAQSEDVLAKSKSSGADAFITKPFTSDEVANRIEKLLSGSDTSAVEADSGISGAATGRKAWIDFRRKVALVPEDQRRHPRLEFHCPVRIEGYQGVYNVTDISLGGVFVELEETEAFDVGQVRQLTIKVPTEYEPIKLKAEVVNIRKRGVGFKYVELTPKNQEMIRFCFDTFKDTIPLK